MSPLRGVWGAEPTHKTKGGLGESPIAYFLPSLCFIDYVVFYWYWGGAPKPPILSKRHGHK